MRKKLTERKWLEISKRDTNPTQTLHRLKSQANRAINDLVLLARKLPEDTQAEIFSYENMEKLIEAIIGEHEDISMLSLSEFRNRITHISYLLLKLGISVCIGNYINYIEQDPVLHSATVDKLRNTIETCEAISLKMYMIGSSYKAGLDFLFNWSKITHEEWTSMDKIVGEQNRRLIQYVNYEFGHGKMRNVQIIKLKKTPRLIGCDFDTDDDVYFECLFDMDDNQRLIYERIFEVSSDVGPANFKKIFEDNLIIKKEDGNLLVFKKKEG